jgi:hypothetical protein
MRDMTQMTPMVMATGAMNSSDSYQWTAHATIMRATLEIRRRVGSRMLGTPGPTSGVGDDEMPIFAVAAVLAAVAVTPSAGGRQVVVARFSFRVR